MGGGVGIAKPKKDSHKENLATPKMPSDGKCKKIIRAVRNLKILYLNKSSKI